MGWCLFHTQRRSRKIMGVGIKLTLQQLLVDLGLELVTTCSSVGCEHRRLSLSCSCSSCRLSGDAFQDTPHRQTAIRKNGVRKRDSMSMCHRALPVEGRYTVHAQAAEVRHSLSISSFLTCQLLVFRCTIEPPYAYSAGEGVAASTETARPQLTRRCSNSVSRRLSRRGAAVDCAWFGRCTGAVPACVHVPSLPRDCGGRNSVGGVV